MTIKERDLFDAGFTESDVENLHRRLAAAEGNLDELIQCYPADSGWHSGLPLPWLWLCSSPPYAPPRNTSSLEVWVLL